MSEGLEPLLNERYNAEEAPERIEVEDKSPQLRDFGRAPWAMSL